MKQRLSLLRRFLQRPSIPKTLIAGFLFISLMLASLVSAKAAPQLTSAADSGTTTPEGKITHWGADSSTMNRKTHVVELRGNAYLARNNEDIKADEIDYNIDTQYVKARGRVRYQYGAYYVRAESIELDLPKKTGVIINGDLSNGQFGLRGERMEQIGQDRYLVKNYDYTTCLDCPNSWAMTGDSADITFEGYAFINDFIFKVKDTPFFWLPYMIVPIKTKRQSGILFPRFGYNEVHGGFFVQPGYWAINDWSDMTLGLGKYGRRGARTEWEGRYALTDRSNGTLNFYYMRDELTPDTPMRFAATTSITQELPFGFESKLRINEISDPQYPITFSEDVMGRYEPVLSSDFFMSKNSTDLSAVVSVRRLRNLLYFDNNKQFKKGFDQKTVQEFPRVVVSTNDRFLFGSNIAAGVEARFNRFTRGEGSFDEFNDSSGKTQIIRKANRFTLIPGLYTTLNPKPWLSVVPSVQYRSFYYNFNNDYKSLARGYLLAQAEASVQLEKIYKTDEPDISYKHSIRPMIKYNTIPTIQESSDHPFIQQVQERGKAGQYFDNWDIVPLGTSQNLESYFTPLGNSLTYGITSQVFRKDSQDVTDTKVTRILEFNASQTLDILESQRFLASGQREDRVILSPFFASLYYSNSKLVFQGEYTYYSFLDRYKDALLITYPNPHRFNATLNWTWEQATKQAVLWFERSIGLTYSFSRLTSKVSSLRTDLRYSINDYIMPKISYSMDLMSNPKQILESKYSVVFQSPSRCWRIEAGLARSVDRGFEFISGFAFNLTGDNFSTVYGRDSLRN